MNFRKMKNHNNVSSVKDKSSVSPKELFETTDVAGENKTKRNSTRKTITRGRKNIYSEKKSPAENLILLCRQKSQKSYYVQLK